MANDEIIPKGSFGICHFVIHSTFDIRHSTFCKRGTAAFTIIELLVVISIIIILAGLILSTVGYVQKKGARSRAEAEIAAISAALENYKADNGIYPNGADTDAVDPTKDLDNTSTAGATKYGKASLLLYKALSGDADADANRVPEQKSYFSFKPKMLEPWGGSGSVTAICDPFGYSYGYSTMKASGGTSGYNPTFDLWSTSGRREPTDTDQSYVARWTKNW
jgi:type II secretory pathway pseudopilin PulG